MIPVLEKTDRRIDDLLTLFPQKGSALLPALHLIQEETGYISADSMKYVAGKIGVSPAFVAGVVSFYTMYHRKPVGRHHLQICRTLACALGGCRSLLERIEGKLGIKPGETTADGRFSLELVECLGACDQAPMMQINDRDCGRVDAAKLEAVLKELG